MDVVPEQVKSGLLCVTQLVAVLALGFNEKTAELTIEILMRETENIGQRHLAAFFHVYRSYLHKSENIPQIVLELIFRIAREVVFVGTEFIQPTPRLARLP